MGTGQMMLVIGAFTIFGIVKLNYQDLTMQSSELLDSNMYLQTSSSIARSMMEEIRQYDFDAALANKSVIKLSDLTSCGAGSGEKYPNFNDLDDFHRSSFSSPASGDTLPKPNLPPCLWGTEGYQVDVNVEYVDPANPDTKSSSRTFAKRVTVTVSNIYSEYNHTSSFVATY